MTTRDNALPLTIFTGTKAQFIKLAPLMLEFERRDGATFDSETGTLWSPDGVGLEGELAGVQLTFVTSFLTEWYGWAAFHPDTGIYGAE